MKAVLATPFFALTLASAVSPALADDPQTDGGAHVGGCVEHVPAGTASPVKAAQFPDKGTAGYGVTLVVEVVHKKGEQVLTRDFGEGSETAIALAKAGFAFATPDGGAGAMTKPTDDGTHLEVPLVLLPKVAGTHHPDAAANPRHGEPQPRRHVHRLHAGAHHCRGGPDGADARG